MALLGRACRHWAQLHNSRIASSCVPPIAHHQLSITHTHPGFRHACGIRGIATSNLHSVAQRAMGGHGTGMDGRRRIAGVVFDMDGTLTVPCIDFAMMRQRVGVASGDILDVINAWPEDRRQRAYDVIAEIEEQALRDMKVMPGAAELCDLLDGANIPRGLITRNVKLSVEYFHRNHFPTRPFHPAITRECSFPYKPSPAALAHICATWGIQPSECLMVGDSAKDDVVSGNRAGAISVLLDADGRYGPSGEALSGEAVPHYTVRSLDQLRQLLQEEFYLQPPPGAQSILIHTK